MSLSREKLIGILFLLGGMTLFGSATPVSKMVGEGFPVFTASLFRVVLGALALLPFVLGDFRQQLRRLERDDWMNLSIIALFGMIGFTVFLIYGMKYITGVAGSIIMSFTPALTAMAAYLFMRSPMDWRRTVAVVLGVGGVLVINIFRSEFDDDGSQYFYLGVLLVLAAISCEAAYTLIGKKATEHLPPLFASFMACVLSIPLFILLALIDYRQADLAAIDAASWGAMLWWGIGTLAAGSALWYSGVSKAEGTTAAGFMAIMPASALILSYWLLGEAFKSIHLIGIVLVMASVAIMSWVHASSMKESDTEEGEESAASRDSRLLCSCHCPCMMPRSSVSSR